MKKLFVLFLFLFSIGSYAQKLTINDIPEGVKKTFEILRPGISPTWEKAGENFVSKFKLPLSGATEMFFEPSGMLKMTRYLLNKTIVPQKITSYAKANSQGFKVAKYYYQVMQGEDSYIVEMAKGAEKKLLKFSTAGKFISEELLK